MGNAVVIAPATEQQPVRSSSDGSAPWLAAVFLASLWFILCRHLSGEWSANEQYSYGWFVPFFAAYLFWLRWDDRPAGTGGLDRSAAQGSGTEAGALEHQDRLGLGGNVERPTSNVQHRTTGRQKSELRNPQSAIAVAVLAVAALAILAPLRLFEVGNPDWRPLGWVHAAVVVTTTLIVIWAAGGIRWVRHFAFPVAFIFVAVPWITPVEGPVVQGLMRVVAAIAAETLALFGVPAQLEGSVVRISSGVVGVNEACSGVRSLQTSLMIGLLFGELKRLGVLRRAALVLVAVAIAFVANCARAFFLVWIAAHQDPSAVDKWHDLAGYAIVGIVFVGTIVAAGLLSRGNDDDAATAGHSDGGAGGTGEQPATAVRRFALPSSYFALALVWVFCVEGGVEWWYRSHERELVPRARWTIQPPESAPGFRTLEIGEDVARILRFDEGRQLTWLVPGFQDSARPPTANLFFFRWEPGSSSILRARSHRPDICLPSVGWRQLADRGVRRYDVGDGLSLPFHSFVFVREAGGRPVAVAHTFFCVQEDRVDPKRVTAETVAVDANGARYGRSDLVRVVSEGQRNPGQQVLQLVFITSPEVSAEAAEARFRELLPEVVKVGQQPKS